MIFKSYLRDGKVPGIEQLSALPNQSRFPLLATPASVASARNCPSFLFALQGTVAWPKPALHH